MSGVAAASQEAAQLSFKLGQDQLAWAKDQFAQNKGMTDQIVQSMLSDSASARALQEKQLALQNSALGIQQGQLDLQRKNQQNSDELYQRYKDVYQPAQDQYLADANAYDTPQRRDQMMGAAQAQVGDQFAAARDSATRQLESFGVNPASTRFAALDLGTRVQEAAAKAAAGNQAALNTEATGFALRNQAIGMGNPLLGASNASANTANASGSNALGATGQAVNAGNSALGAVTGAAGISGNANNAQNATYATGAGAMGNPASYIGTGTSALGQWGNTLNQGYQNQLSEFKANQSASSGIGSMLGGIAGLGMSAIPGGSIFGKVLGFAEGGAIPMGASPSGGAITDDVPAQVNGGPEVRVNAGEFIIPRDVVAWEGEKSLQNLIMKARKAKEGAGAKPAIGNAPAQPRPAIGAAA